MDGTRMSADVRSSYLFNATIPGIEACDSCLIIGANPRMEAPLLNTRLRKAYLNGLDIALIGHDALLNYEKDVLGADLSALEDIVEGRSAYAQTLADAQQPLVIIGMSALKGAKYAQTMSLVRRLVAKFPALQQPTRDDGEPGWNGVSFLQTRAGRNGGLDIGFVSLADEAEVVANARFVYCLGGDEYHKLKEVPSDALVVYQGSHGDRGARRADVVLPGCSWAEKNGTFVNVDGRVQRSKAALTAPGQARNDWQILRALAEVAGVDLGYDDIEGLRQRMFEVAPHLEKVDTIEPSEFNVVGGDECEPAVGGDHTNAVVAVDNEPFEKYFTNYFATDPISRSSLTLRKAAKQLPKSTNSWC